MAKLDKGRVARAARIGLDLGLVKWSRPIRDRCYDSRDAKPDVKRYLEGLGKPYGSSYRYKPAAYNGSSRTRYVLSVRGRDFASFTDITEAWAQAISMQEYGNLPVKVFKV